MQKLLILCSREPMSLNQGQFCAVSPIRNLTCPHTLRQVFFLLPTRRSRCVMVMGGTSLQRFCEGRNEAQFSDEDIMVQRQRQWTGPSTRTRHKLNQPTRHTRQKAPLTDAQRDEMIEEPMYLLAAAVMGTSWTDDRHSDPPKLDQLHFPSRM